MRLQLEEIIADLRQKLSAEKGLRNTVWLKSALSNLEKYKKANEKKLV